MSITDLTVPELDRLVAEKVMGWDTKKIGAHWFINSGPFHGTLIAPNRDRWGPASIVDHTWHVVKRMQELGWYWSINECPAGWTVKIRPHGEHALSGPSYPCIVDKSFTLAVCQVALMAVESST